MKKVVGGTGFYDLISTVYNPCLDWVFNPGRKKVADVLNCQNNLKILEIGSGTGSFVKFLNFDSNYVGIESSSRMFDVSKRDYPNHLFLNTKYEDYQTLDKFDIIVINYTLSVVDDPIDLMKTIYDWLDIGGKVYIVNHFSADNLLYKLLQRVSIYFGYNAYFPFSPNLFSNYFNITIFESVNLFGGWKFIELTPKGNEQE